MHKRIVTVIVVSAAFLAACSKAPQEQAAAGNEPEAPANAQHQAAPDAHSGPVLHRYGCESGKVVEVMYPSVDTATVQYDDETHEMRLAISGSGARYVGDGLEWWTKGSDSGSEGTLFHHQSDDTTGDTVERCLEN